MNHKRSNSFKASRPSDHNPAYPIHDTMTSTTKFVARQRMSLQH